MSRAARIQRRLEDWLLAEGWKAPGVEPGYGPHGWSLPLPKNGPTYCTIRCGSLGTAVDEQLRREKTDGSCKTK
jgi:hypothetical protein